MGLQKKCGTCGEKKSLHEDFAIMEGRKRYPDCNECRNMKQAGLNPVPDDAHIAKAVTVDADRKRRQEQYRKAIKRQKAGLST